MSSVQSRESEELGEQLVTLKTKCENLEGHVAEKEEEFEETLWRWQEFQSDIDACFRNLAMIEKSLDFQSLDDGELEDRRDTHQVRACHFSCQFVVLGSVNDTPEQSENVGFTLKTHQMFSFHTTLEEFENVTISGHFGFEFEGTRATKSRDYCDRDSIVMEKPLFQNVFRPYKNEKPTFLNSSVLKSFFEKLRFRGRKKYGQ